MARRALSSYYIDKGYLSVASACHEPSVAATGSEHRLICQGEAAAWQGGAKVNAPALGFNRIAPDRSLERLVSARERAWRESQAIRLAPGRAREGRRKAGRQAGRQRERQRGRAERCLAFSFVCRSSGTAPESELPFEHPVSRREAFLEKQQARCKERGTAWPKEGGRRRGNRSHFGSRCLQRLRRRPDPRQLKGGLWGGREVPDCLWNSPRPAQVLFASN